MKNYYFDISKPLRPFTFEAESNANSHAPRNALRVEPVFKEGFWPCESNGAWEQVEDNRGKTFYSTQTGEKVEIKEVGIFPASLTDQPRPDESYTWGGSTWIPSPDLNEFTEPS